jgi:uncharacterized protein YigE (DUF2233 family)
MKPALLILFLVFGAVAFAQEAPALLVNSLSFQGNRRVVQVWLTTFSADRHALRVIDNTSPGQPYRYADLSLAMRGEGCVAGCNGGFFERSPFVPSGYLISDGRASGVFKPASWLNGMLVVRKGVPALEAIYGFKPGDAEVTQLLQSGPWLVRAGAAEKDNNNTLQAPRTFVGTDGNGVWFLGVTDDCTLQELADFLMSEKIRKVVKVREALNLDGGPSTGLWVKDARFYQREKWTVQNYLGVVAR